MNTIMNLEEQTNKYNDLVAAHLREAPGRMFIFELTKCCNYSTLIYMYKEDRLCDLFTQTAKHLGCKNLIELYMLDQNGNKNLIPFNSSTFLKDFIFDNTQANNRILKPIYDLPLPVVYRIQVDDGHCHVHP